MFLYSLGRALQGLGLVVMLIGVAGNMYDQGQVPLKTTLAMAGVGMLIFFVGWSLQQLGRPK